MTTWRCEDGRRNPAPAAGSPAYGNATAACPPGQRAVGGGNTFYLTNEPQYIRVEATGPLDETGLTANLEDGDIARFWTVEARNFETHRPELVYVYALCSPTSRATVEMTPLSFAGQGGATVACPQGGRAVAGGLVSPTTLEAFTEFSAPTTASGANLLTGDTPQGWTTVVNNFGAGSQNFKASAICEPPTTASAPAPSATGERTKALAKCKKKHSRKARKKCKKKAALLPV
jgi:hypothetical protein